MDIRLKNISEIKLNVKDGFTPAKDLFTFKFTPQIEVLEDKKTVRFTLYTIFEGKSYGEIFSTGIVMELIVDNLDEIIEHKDKKQRLSHVLLKLSYSSMRGIMYEQLKGYPQFKGLKLPLQKFETE